MSITNNDQIPTPLTDAALATLAGLGFAEKGWYATQEMARHARDLERKLATKRDVIGRPTRTMNTRTEIEALPRCVWFDRQCPACGKEMRAYDAAGFSYDYALLCQTPDCKNWQRVCLLGDQANGCTEADFRPLAGLSVEDPAESGAHPSCPDTGPEGEPGSFGPDHTTDT